MPNRILREGILTSPRMASLNWAEEVFYRRLHSVVDDFGRYFADVGLLRAACYPRQLNKVSDSDIGKWLTALVEAALVRVYPAQDGERYLEVLDFGQQIRAKKSKFPDSLSTCVADAKQVIANEHLDVSVSVSVSDKGSRKRSPGFDAKSIQLPEWLDSELWALWVDDRRERKKPVTEAGASMQIKALDDYRAQGFTPKQVIEHSIAGGYQGLFAPSKQAVSASVAASSSPSKAVDETQAYLAQLAEETKRARESNAARKAAQSQGATQ